MAHDGWLHDARGADATARSLPFNEAEVEGGIALPIVDVELRLALEACAAAAASRTAKDFEAFQ